LKEEEFDEMWSYLKTDLPNSFRFTGTKSDALAVREIFKKRYIPAIEALDFEGTKVEPPKAVEGFPDELVWDMKTHKKVIRRHKPFAEFQKFLVAETTSGNISRQEVVSMIPPHFLDVKPGMVVLDMCAAPGSKSAQLAEMIHGDEEERVVRAANNQSPNIDDGGDYSDDGRSTGLLIANDTDYKRAGMLVHQVKRLNFPNLIVTQHDASIYPSIELPPTEDDKKKQYLKFDRILTDVPCSGDGTARKNPNVWQKWTPKDGLGLHNLQLRILFRGLQMLKKGGRLVYSTCSMNPVENEAVVAAAIEACGGVSKVRLVDCSDHLPRLKRVPGLNKWKVFDTSVVPGEEKVGHLFSSWDLFVNAQKKYQTEEPNRQFSSKISPGCFPPSPLSEEERIPLERCMRVYPHLQDTGGFFIAVLEKLEDIKVAQIRNSNNEAEQRKMQEESEITTPVPAEEDINSKEETVDVPNGDATSEDQAALKRKLEESQDSPAMKRMKADKLPTNATANELEEEDVKPGASASLDVDEVEPATNDSTNVSTPAPSNELKKLKPEFQSQNKEYFEYLPPNDTTIAGILEFFGISERFPRDRFMVKNKEGLALNKIYYTSALAKSIISQNRNRGMKFIHCGVVMFVSHKLKDGDLKAPWRLQNEGIRILEPWASKRIVNCTSKRTLYKMLIEMFPKLPKDGSHEIDEIGDQLMEMEIGCSFLRVEQSDGEDGFPFRMVLPLWRHPGSANMMVDKDDRKAMLLRLFNETDPVIKNHVLEKAKALEEGRQTYEQQIEVRVNETARELKEEIKDVREAMKEEAPVLSEDMEVDT
jgi:multisite-specific tRNA:(cytosine-C5)-methyltransferase